MENMEKIDFNRLCTFAWSVLFCILFLSETKRYDKREVIKNMFRKTKRRIATALIVTTLAGGGAAVNKDVICQKTGVDLNRLNLENIQNTKEIEKIFEKYGIEEASQIAESKWTEAANILSGLNINPIAIAESAFSQTEELIYQIKNALPIQH